MNKSLNQYLLFLHWMNLNFWMNKKVIHSVPNSKYRLIFLKITGETQTLFGKNVGVIRYTTQNNNLWNLICKHGKNSLQWSVVFNIEHVKHHFTTYMYNNSAGHYSSQTDQDNSLLYTCRLNWHSSRKWSQNTENRDPEI